MAVRPRARRPGARRQHRRCDVAGLGRQPDADRVVALFRASAWWRRSRLHVSRQPPACRGATALAARRGHARRAVRRASWVCRRVRRARARSAPGRSYFDQGGQRENPQELYLRYANVRFPNVLPGIDLQLGRMGYTSGAEAPSGVPKIETVKRQRLDSRLVGEFEWSLYQRGFDGVRVDATRSRWRATGIAVMPTQGGFARVGRIRPSPTSSWRAAPSSSRPAAGTALVAARRCRDSVCTTATAVR